MLDDKELDKLCHGRVIKANTYDTQGQATEPHYAIVLDSDQQIKKSRKIHCIFVSTKDYLKPVIPAPASSGLKGYVIGRWREKVEEAAMVKICKEVLNAIDMIKVIQLVRQTEAIERTEKTKP